MNANKMLVAILLCSAFAVSGSVYAGETITFSNAGGTGSVSKFSQCNFSLRIPSTQDLPAGSVVRIKSIAFAQVADRAATNENDPHSLALNGCRSAARVESGTIMANADSSRTALLYEFTNDCHIVVGKTYEAAEAGDRMQLGKGVTFLHSNGNRWSSGTTMQAAVTFVSNPSSHIVENASEAVSGYYPVCSIEAEIVSTTTAWTGAADSSFSNAENWTGGLPQAGAGFSICISGNKTLDLSGATPFEAGVIAVDGTGTLTIEGTGSSDSPVLTAEELAANTAVIFETAAFQPSNITFGDRGSVAIGQNGFLLGTVSYSSSMPTQSAVFTSTNYASSVTDKSKWNGTIWLKKISGVINLESNPYGNKSSLLRLSDIAGYLKSPGNYAFTNSVPIELKNGGLSLTGGFSANDSNKNRFTIIQKLSGSANFYGNTTANKQVTIIHDASEFTGAIQLDGKFVSFGETLPTYSEIASSKIVIEKDAVVSVKSTTNNLWYASNGIIVKGRLTAKNLSHFGGGTTLQVKDSGTFVLTNDDNVNETADNYARLVGTGTLRLESKSNWRAVSTNNFPLSLTLQNELGDGLLLGVPKHTFEIGSLSGSGNIRTDYGTGDRSLVVYQATNTTWSGVFTSHDRLETLTIRRVASSGGTLTIAGEITHNNNLVVESGTGVNIAGTWTGPVSVQEGATISGSGTLNGALTLADGAVITAGQESGMLAVSGNVTAEGALTIRLPESVASSGIKSIPLLKISGTSSIDGSRISLETGSAARNWRLFYRTSSAGTAILGVTNRPTLIISVR